MRKYRMRMMMIALFGLLASVGLATPTVAETGAVSVVLHQVAGSLSASAVAKACDLPRQVVSLHRVGHERGFHHRRLDTKFVGRALNLRSPGDLAGSCATGGAGAALARAR